MTTILRVGLPVSTLCHALQPPGQLLPFFSVLLVLAAPHPPFSLGDQNDSPGWRQMDGRGSETRRRETTANSPDCEGGDEGAAGQALNLRHLGVRNDWADGCGTSLEGGLARPPIRWGEEEEGLAPARS